jgi:hypothetical protein
METGVWIVQQTPELEYNVHHKINQYYPNLREAVASGVRVVTLLIKEYCSEEKNVKLIMAEHTLNDVEGLLICTENVPWACFIPGAGTEEGKSFVYDMDEKQTIIVPTDIPEA